MQKASHIKITTNGIRNRAKKISKEAVRKKLKDSKYDPCAVSAKFLNTFMHQLMKYEEFRGLYEQLHLTLDNGVLKKECVREILESIISNAYTMDYTTYETIQKNLRAVLEGYNKQLKGVGIKLRSRIELNSILWAGEAKGKKRKK